jgi:integrase
MPSPPKSERAPKVVRKRLADGTIREYRYARGPVEPERHDAGSMAALIAAYRGSPEWAAKAKQTKATYNIYLRPWEDERLARAAVTSIKRRDILTIRDAIASARGNGAATGFGRITAALFAFALDRGWIEYSPAARIKRLPGGHLLDWGERSIAHALDKLPEPYRRAVVLAVHTGQRRGDLVAMTWGQYDGATIRLRQGKTGALMALPVHPNLQAELDSWKQDRASVAILTAPRGQPWTAPHLTREMKRELEKIGLPGLNVHGLRKAAARRLAEAGCSAHEIAAVTGHRTLAMVELYTRAADQEKMAGAAVVRLTGNRTTKPRN